MKPQIHELLNATPFREFSILMNDGRSFRIEHPDFAFAGPLPTTPVIVEIERKQHMLNPRLIASVETAEPEHH